LITVATSARRARRAGIFPGVGALILQVTDIVGSLANMGSVEQALRCGIAAVGRRLTARGLTVRGDMKAAATRRVPASPCLPACPRRHTPLFHYHLPLTFLPPPLPFGFPYWRCASDAASIQRWRRMPPGQRIGARCDLVCGMTAASGTLHISARAYANDEHDHAYVSLAIIIAPRCFRAYSTRHRAVTTGSVIHLRNSISRASPDIVTILSAFNTTPHVMTSRRIRRRCHAHLSPSLNMTTAVNLVCQTTAIATWLGVNARGIAAVFS